MNNAFDFDTAIAEFDKGNSLGSIEQLGDQVQHIWELAQGLSIDSSYRDVDLVVVAGMGGSVLGTHVIQTVYKDELKVPVIVCGDYSLPSYVNHRTLVIASSYSGTTEETLAAAEDAKQKGAKIVGICSGDKLAEFLLSNNYPALVFEPIYNPCNTPRMALGYAVFGQMALFSKVGLLDITENDYQEVLDLIAKVQLTASRHIDHDSNPAKLLAFQLLDRIPVITAAEHLEGASHVMANQLNENAKTFAEYRVVPELNHHLMEGLQFPKHNEDTLLFVTIHSKLYTPSNEKRMTLSEQVLEKNGIEYIPYHLQSTSKLGQAFELLLLASYTSFYLAMLHHLDPTPNPWVDWFKSELKKG